jgi:hypothetical protein
MQPLLIGGKPQLSYQVHRAVDERTEIITILPLVNKTSILS